MPPATPEAQPRAHIDAQFVAAGWLIQDYEAVNFSAGRSIALFKVKLTTGPCDYHLLVDRLAKPTPYRGQNRAMMALAETLETQFAASRATAAKLVAALVAELTAAA